MTDPFNALPLLPLLLAGGLAFSRPKRTGLDVTGGIARMGYGIAQCMLALFVAEIHLVCVHAAPEAQNGWSAFIGMVSFALVFPLALGLASLLLLGPAQIAGYRGYAVIHQPFWAGGFVDFWCRWGLGSPPAVPSFRQAFVRCLAVLASLMLLWQDLHLGHFLWLVVHTALLLLDLWLGRGRAWERRVPHIVRSVLVIVVFTLTTPLLYRDVPAEALAEWGRLFTQPADTLYSVFLDARLMTSRTCWLLWAAFVTVVLLPGMPWWLVQKSRVRRVSTGGGLAFLGLFMAVALSFTGDPVPEPVQRAGHHFSRWLNSDGNAQVVIGDEGWLFPKTELNRLTQRRDVPGHLDTLLPLTARLKAQGAALLVLMVPDKLALYPEPILPAKYSGPVYPPHYLSAIAQLRTAGADVLDLTPKLWDDRRRKPLYSAQDSHWTAEAMKDLALQTSYHIRKQYPQVVQTDTPMVNASFMERQDMGDLPHRLDGDHAAWFWQADAIHMVGLRGLTTAAESLVLVVGGDLVRVFDDPHLSFGPQAETDAPAAWGTQLGALIGQGLEVVPEADTETLIQQAKGKKLVVWVVRAGEL